MSRAFLVGGADSSAAASSRRWPRRGKRPRRRAATISISPRARRRRWRQKLAGVEVVVNCAGIGRDGRVDNLRAAHVDGPSRLAAACKTAGVRRLVHVSALGAAAGDPSRFLASKGEGEAALARGRRPRSLRRAAVAGAGRGRRGRRFLRRARRAAGAAAARTGKLARAAAARRRTRGADRQARAGAASPAERRRGRPGSDDDRRARSRPARLARPQAGALSAAAALCIGGAGVGERDRRGWARRS